MNIELNDMTSLFQNLEDIMHNTDTNQEIKEMMIKKSFLYHYNNNEDYRKYADIYNGGVFDIKNFNINDIPLLPSSFFKKNINIITASKEDIIKYCTSSGTQGNLSIVPRDEETLLNFYSSISATMPIYFDIEREGNHRVFILGPDTEVSGDLWFSYVLASMALNYQTNYMEKDNEFSLFDTYTQLKEAVNQGNEILVIGPPFRVIELCEYMKDNNLSLDFTDNSYVISAGGWKGKQAKAISRDTYAEIVKEVFNIPDECISDSFNMVELNSVVSECKYHQKHVLPWMDVIARDPLTNEIIEEGKEGILSYYDASSLSYPCFILGEDYGIIHTEKCKCGMVTKRFEITRRMNRVESRGCALKMATGKTRIEDNQKYRYFNSFYRDKQSYIDEVDDSANV